MNINFTRWMNRSFEGPERIRYNELCEEARNIPEWLAAEAVREKSFPHKEMPRWLWISNIAAIATLAALAALAIREFRSRRCLGRKRERDIEADADGEAPPPKALRFAISPEPGSTDRRIYSFPDASAFPSLSTVSSTLTTSSTGVSLSVDEPNNESETSVTDPESVESETEELVEEERSRYDKHGDDDDDDETESAQTENEGNDDKEIKSDRSEDGEIEEIPIDEPEAKETSNEA